MPTEREREADRRYRARKSLDPEWRAAQAARSRRFHARHPDRSAAIRRSWRKRNPATFAWTCCRNSAKQRGITFDLPRPLLEDLVTDSCYYCGAGPNPINGIDRVDNDKGYLPDNVVTCCKVCNVAKARMGVSDFLAWARRVAGRFPIARTA